MTTGQPWTRAFDSWDDFTTLPSSKGTLKETHSRMGCFSAGWPFSHCLVVVPEASAGLEEQDRHLTSSGGGDLGPGTKPKKRSPGFCVQNPEEKKKAQTTRSTDKILRVWLSELKSVRKQWVPPKKTHPENCTKVTP